MLPGLLALCGAALGSNWAILSDFDVIMFFRKDRPQREGRSCADGTESTYRRVNNGGTPEGARAGHSWPRRMPHLRGALDTKDGERQAP